jgi:FkbM family methyltransferase
MKIPDWKWILKWKVIYPIRHGHSYSSGYEIGVRRVLMPLSGHEFWDVGANTGHYTFMLAKNFDLVRAFEPNPQALRILTQKVAKTNSNNVQVVPLALSDFIGKSRLYLHTEIHENTIGSSNSFFSYSKIPMQRSDECKEMNLVPFIEVETNTVDNILGNESVDLMKIDVEGAEFMVLKGAVKALTEGRIINLMIELHHGEQKDKLDSLLARHHYRTNWLDHVPGAEVSRVFATLLDQ